MHDLGDSPSREFRRPRPIISPVPHAMNPILMDRPVVSPDGSRESVFLTPSSTTIEQKMPLITVTFAGVFLLGSFVSRRLGAPSPLVNLLTLGAFTLGSIPAFRSAWDTIRRYRLDIDTLMLLGAGLAAFVGSPFEGALLLFLFALSAALEEYSLKRTQAAIISLHNLVPTEAIVLDGEDQRRVTLRQVRVGDRVLVRPGDRVPLDGEVIEGESSVDEAAITGESLPVEKASGSAVFAGTANMQGRLVVRVSKLSADTTVARILKLVTEAKHKTARAQRLIDRIGPTYSVVVIFGSMAAGLGLHFLGGVAGREAAYRAIALLIVCSPCALAIATPVAYLSAIAAAARRGIVIKGGAYLETLAGVRAAVFDKTGTLTTGNVRLVRIRTHESINEDDALRAAAALETSSSHPLAGAVIAELKRRNLDAPQVSQLKSEAGHGISGTVAGAPVWIGRPRFARERVKENLRDSLAEQLDAQNSAGKAAAVLVMDGVPSLFEFEDVLRDTARDTVDRLRRNGLQRIEMFTGDNEGVASAIASQLALDGYRAELLPEEKLSEAESFRKEHGAIVMIGDGVNDAPTLATADVGIAIGSIGADVALEAADIVLMNDSIEGVAWLREHALRTTRIVRQNLALAIGVIIVLSGFALTGHIPLPLAVVGHEGSTVVVALNALRLLRHRD